MTRVIQLTNRWTLGSELGSGGFGHVYEAVDENGRPAAAKLVPKLPGADRELLIARDATGLPNVVPVIDDGEDGNDYVIVMPLADRSLEAELGGRTAPLAADEVVGILTDLATALAAVHDKGIVNRDIKPPNALLLDGRWSLSDFGIAQYAEASTAADTFKFAGSWAYVAPERWRGERATKESDVYSFGVMAYELLAGVKPFAGPTQTDYAEQHQHRVPSPLGSVAPKLSSLVLECLDKAPAARPPAANILARLPSIIGPTSGGSAALQAANQELAAKKLEAGAKQAAARTAAERRSQLATSAAARLAQIGEALSARVAEDAPSASLDGARGSATLWSRSLGTATLFMNASVPVDVDAWPPRGARAFDVVAHASIGVRIPKDRHDYEGRRHALWFCDAKEEGDYRWFEVAFMISPILPRTTTVLPFDLPPGDDAWQAIGPGIGSMQAAWPFLPFDRGESDEFFDRWLAWFAAAASGTLTRPSSMPERSDAHNSWRRS